VLKKTVTRMLKRSERNLLVGLEIGHREGRALGARWGLDGSIEVWGSVAALAGVKKGG